MVRAHPGTHFFIIFFIFIKLNIYQKVASLGGLEPPTSRLTVERANQLRHRDNWTALEIFHIFYNKFFYTKMFVFTQVFILFLRHFYTICYTFFTPFYTIFTPFLIFYPVYYNLLGLRTLLGKHATVCNIRYVSY